jgi:3-dehydroquinate synthase
MDLVSVNQPLIRQTLPAGGETTELILGHGVLRQAVDLLDRYRGVRLLLVTDSQVAQLYTHSLRDSLIYAGYDAHVLLVPAGEEAKTLDTLTRLYTVCQALQVERHDVVVAVGGGAIGDVAGMLAGTYLRGLVFVQIPTTLVAQVTASIGGKVGVNFGGYKNVIGMFNQPALVLGDVTTLETLPSAEFRSGLGELVTVGVLGAPQIFEALETRGTADLTSLIAQAIICKSRIVEADPFDQMGVRARLNLGHTFGHALEKLSDFTLPHGLAVAVGLHIACRLAVALDLCPAALCERIHATLRALDLPVGLTGYDPQVVLQAMRGDKKRSGGRLQWVLPVALGHVELVGEERVPVDLLLRVLHTLVWEGVN